jgi:hypothetical protein
MKRSVPGKRALRFQRFIGCNVGKRATSETDVSRRGGEDEEPDSGRRQVSAANKGKEVPTLS